MSDNAVLLVCAPEDPYRAAAHALERLAGRRIIEALPSDCVRVGLGHRPGPAAVEVVASPHPLFGTLAVNGLEVEPRTMLQLVCGDSDEIPRVTCPSCEHAVDEDVVVENLGPGNPFTGPLRLTCAGCGLTRRFDELTPHGAAFGRLVFRFWNWPGLRDAFVREMEGWCGAPITRLHEHV